MKRARVRICGSIVPWFCLRLFFITLMMVSGTRFTFGQVSASMSGRVQDASGAGVAQAAVTVTSQETECGTDSHHG